MESQDVESLERVLDPPFCYKCGQALDWSNEKEESAFEEAMQELRKQIGGQHAKTEPEANETAPTDKPSA
jgi:hypothetical protein